MHTPRKIRAVSLFSVALSLCLLIGSAFAQEDPTAQIEQLNNDLRSLATGQQAAGFAQQAVQLAKQRQVLLLKLAAEKPDAALNLTLSPEALASLPAAAKAFVESDADVQGEMEVLVEDYQNTHRMRYFLQTAKERIELYFANGTPRRLMTGARVRARGKRLDGSMLVPLNGTTSGTTSGLQLLSQPLPNTFGAQSTIVIMVTFQDNATQPMTTASARDLVFTQVSNFDRENSQNQTWLTGDLYGYFPIAMNSTSCDTNTLASLANQAATNAGANLSSYRHIVYMFPTISACGWSGLGTIGGNPSKAWINGNFSTLVVGHEMGHNFGLYHAHALNCNGSTLGSNCSSIEYGDPFEIMGNATASHFGAFHKEQLGWLNYGSSLPITTVSTGGTYNLTPYASSVAGPKALKVLKSTDASTGAKTWYYIEYRQPVGFDSGLSRYPASTQGVVIRTGAESPADSSYLLDINPSTSSFSDAALGIGKSYTDSAAGVTITVVSADANGASVKVDLGTSTTCTTAAPSVSISPTAGPSVSAGTAVSYTATVTNRDSAQCNNSTFNLTSTVPSGWTGTLSTTSLNLAPGANGTATLQVTSPSGTASGTYNVSVAAQSATSGLQASAGATYTVATGTTTAGAKLTSPTPGSTLPGSTVTFAWSGTGVSQYWLYVGNSAGAADIYNANQGTNTSVTVSSIPVDGRTIYVRLWYVINSAWKYTDYTFKAATQGGGGGTSAPATLLTPAPGSKMTSTTQTFSWTTGTGVSQYWLYIGTSPGSSNLYSASQGPRTSVTLSGFPTGSRTFYIRLWSYLSTGWTYEDYSVIGPN